MKHLDSQRVTACRSLAVTQPFVVLFVLAMAVVVSDNPSYAQTDAQTADQEINFNRDIRPILSDKCFYCHGPDEGHREADLRLDLQEAAHDYAIVPGEPDDSDLVERITSDDSDFLMPPPESGKELKPHEIELLKKWIAKGGTYEGHWSFQLPKKADPPQVKQKDWVKNSIDQFVLAKLEAEKLGPAKELDRAKLIRRVSLDLTGIPPTPAEVDAFINDPSDDAYEKVIDRLLASERYGERMALVWLDAARYADTNGYQVDLKREMWAWRDWVIEAYNNNMPFDDFTQQQIAGDMMPDATLEQKIASAFNRNHRINGEGGAIPEEFRTEYVIDRVSTTGTVWLGMTFECARCHSHKYDPVSQEEFYQLFAYFNNVPENGTDGLQGNAKPVMAVPIAEMQPKLEAAQQTVADLEARYMADTDEVVRAREAWVVEEQEKLASGEFKPVWSVAEVTSAASDYGLKLEKQDDDSYLAIGKPPARATYEFVVTPAAGQLNGLRIDALNHPSIKSGGLGISPNGNFVLSEVVVLLQEPDTEKATVIKLATALADHSQAGYSVDNAIDGKAKTGWAVMGKPLTDGRSAVFTFENPVTVTKGAALTIRLKHLSPYSGHSIGRVRLSLTDIAKPTLDNNDGLPKDLNQILVADENSLSDSQRDRVATFFREQTPLLADLRGELATARKALEKVEKVAFTEVMVMQEMAKPRKAFLLNRGQYDQPGKEVQPGVPTSLGKFPTDAPSNRLGFAQWLVEPSNPLTARVAVNRYWQMYFGVGIVKSASDFGSQGEWPSHPELLDWLANKFIDSDWDIKAMQKLIVMSATYRQSSAGTQELRNRDPENRLLARGPRFRLDGFAIRDQALAAAGLLKEKVGGPSVYPYQPSGMWAELAASVGTKYPQSTGDGLYRRSLYTFWKRTVAPPSMVIFDSSTREACNVNRNVTNTPLQSLATLNDVQFVEAARFLAERMMKEGGDAPNQRLSFGWRLLLARSPDDIELGRLEKAFQFHLDRFKQDPQAAKELLSIGERKADENLDAIQLAAYSAIANVILNLDETMTKE